eukprot:TRINITY_DN55628_c0_g1_i1.p1 TRINITY_DN55628_c0_g1~~TRINITY_DN55628_c0_g1_i1.p1  ORF type:complete len:323 (+),score=121.57 TRINITY_DN55628_c0_g1_i1:102-971(+)
MDDNIYFPHQASSYSDWTDESGLAQPTCIPTVPKFEPFDRRKYVKSLRRGKVEQRLNDIKQLFRKYDANGDGVLERDEMHQLLRDMAGGMPTLLDDEIDYVMCSADANSNGVIDEEELPRAIQLWEGYLEHRDEIYAVMERYDTNKDGVLSRDELRAMLSDLKGGCEVATDDEVNEVMRAADVSRTGSLTPREAVFALAYHYSYDDPGSPSKGGNNDNAPNRSRGRNKPVVRRRSSGGVRLLGGGPPGAVGDALVGELTRLFVLHKAGALTAAEFAAAKQALLRPDPEV